MNCQEFHRRLSEDPHCAADEFRAHLRACPDCAAAWRRAREFDALLRQAMEVEVPAGLEQRLLQAPASDTGWRWGWLGRLALAAGFSFVLGSASWLGYRQWLRTDPAASFERIAINHLRDEIQHLNQNRPPSAERLGSVLQPFGLRWISDLSGISFAEICVMRGGTGAHLVFDTGWGRVTVLVVPGESLPAAREFHYAGMAGQLVPMPFGAIAVMGRKPAALEPMRLRLEQALAFEG